ncbi:MAG TPA: UDP-N-acetylglucosamine 1-carboxyvinyltransferase [Candidatus Dormibacteraeota bacterium]|nr:UDP-N-acetylglucosamine 1-carboxyvinyltransferase [Candidatus Dormibacteraeota bacterium]
MTFDRLETTLRLRGGHRLHGAVRVHGSKNATLPIMAASLLCDGDVVIKRAPRITDVSVMEALLESMGARVRQQGTNVLSISAANLGQTRAPYTLVRKLNASFDVTGALLGRLGRAEVPLPGGCVLGTRATDLHEQGFRALGAEVRGERGYLVAEAPHGLHGADITFRFPSVGATKNVMLAAVYAKGTTTLRNAAMEPEVVDLANFLNAAGARVSGQGTDTIVLEGVERLRSVEYEVIGDRIAAGTLMLAGAVTRGAVTVTGTDPAHHEALVAALEECGVVCASGEDWVAVDASGVRSGTDILTAPFPGFPTDLQPMMTAFLATCPGSSVVEETIFNARFAYVNELLRMGADVRVQMDSNAAVVKGPADLEGAPVEAADIRAGAALVVAGLAARGETEIAGLEFIDRGYERLEEMLTELGAQVQRSSGIVALVEPTSSYETTTMPTVG